MGALLQDIEVYITNDDSLPAQALITIREKATKQSLWVLDQENKVPNKLDISNKIKQFHISGKRTLIYHDTFEYPNTGLVTFYHTHIMAQAIHNTCTLCFILKDLNNELSSRFA